MRITRTRVFIATVAVLTIVLGVEIRRGDITSITPSRPSPGAVPQTEDLTPRNPARCPGVVYSGVAPPRKVFDVPPVYPAAAREMEISGVVIVQVLIDKGGEIAAAKVVRSVPPLDKAAIDAVRQWRFTRTMINGAPVCVAMTVTVDVKP